MTPDAFLRDICEHPADDAPRLVYADWLEDHGDPDRAEFIRVQCRIERVLSQDPPPIAPDGLEWYELLDRERELRYAHTAAWRDALPHPAGVKWSTRWWRGFIEEVDLGSAKAFKDHARIVFASSPVRSLTFAARLTPRTLPGVLASPLLARLSSLALNSSTIGDAGATALAGCPHLASLERLRLGSCGIGPPGARALAGSESLRCLRHLLLYDNHIGPEGMQALADSPVVDRLELLNVYGGGFGDAGAEALADSPHLGELREANLGMTGIADAGVRALARSTRLRALRRLYLVANRITDEGARALASMTGLPALTELHLGANEITNPGARALAEGPALERLQRLSVVDYGGRLGREGVTVLRQRFGDRVEVLDPPQ